MVGALRLPDPEGLHSALTTCDPAHAVGPWGEGDTWVIARPCAAPGPLSHRGLELGGGQL